MNPQKNGNAEVMPTKSPSEVEGVATDGVNEAKLLRKLDLRLLPVLSLLYLLSFLDRSNGEPKIHGTRFLPSDG